MHAIPITAPGVLRGEPARQRAAQRCTDGRAEKREPRRQRVETAHLLQIQRGQVNRDGVSDIRHGPRDHQNGEAHVAEQREIEQRPPHSFLDEDEYNQYRNRAAERHDCPRRQETPIRCPVKSQREQSDSDDDQRQSGDVDTTRHAVVGTLRHRQHADHERHQGKRHQQPEDRPPTQRLGQQAADQRACRFAQARDAVCQSDRAAGARSRKGIGQHADRHGKDQRRADALDGAERPTAQAHTVPMRTRTPRCRPAVHGGGRRCPRSGRREPCTHPAPTCRC
jgi:hypothetical protein